MPLKLCVHCTSARSTAVAGCYCRMRSLCILFQLSAAYHLDDVSIQLCSCAFDQCQLVTDTSSVTQSTTTCSLVLSSCCARPATRLLRCIYGTAAIALQPMHDILATAAAGSIMLVEPHSARLPDVMPAPCTGLMGPIYHAGPQCLSCWCANLAPGALAVSIKHSCCVVASRA